MKIRVVTATKGISPFLGDTVNSIENAAPDSQHIIVCPADQASAVRSVAGNATVEAEKQSGLYAALNQGLNVPGEWNFFTALNDDDLLLAPGFRDLINRLAERPEVDIVYGKVELIDRNGSRLGSLPVSRTPDQLLPLLASGIVPLAQPGCAIRKSVFERIGFFDESFRFSGDLDFFVRALVAGCRFDFVDTWVASFRLVGGQLSKERLSVEIETRRALQLLSRRPSRAALLRFRMDNISVYIERLRRHGWISMRNLYDRTS